ncbi:SDR family oxidoreductase [Luteimicrobium xylanilyticum]|uniref:Aurachin B dehydrogenase n=1 Tax=Luteimicrobium xylanilyticum TaxID=1133546 RepID=A0A5P9QDW6_9MICO|nr:SDR family oxidoreductase [Luteimicrobium xylanilyticum]QFU99654.1 Aurachin B dehydrogenase [Luteimicrobium xylanilyticum]
MHVFVTGGTGQTGPAIVSELVGAGHRVTGLARSDAAAARLSALGATPWLGSLDDLDTLSAGAARADGVVHLAFGGDFSDPSAMTRRDVAAIRALGGPLSGTGKPLVVTSGTLVLPAGRVGVESDPASADAVAGLRRDGERACLDLAADGVRSVVVRLAPTVHGPRDHGFVPMLIETARRAGASVYVGDGANRWPAVHRLDAAVLYRLALEAAPAGAVLHGVGEPAVPFRSIAEKIGERLGIPVRSVDPVDAARHFDNPFMATVYGTDAPASSTHTQELLGWAPSHPTLLTDLDDGDYFTAG